MFHFACANKSLSLYFQFLVYNYTHRGGWPSTSLSERYQRMPSYMLAEYGVGFLRYNRSASVRAGEATSIRYGEDGQYGRLMNSTNDAAHARITRYALWQATTCPTQLLATNLAPKSPSSTLLLRRMTARLWRRSCAPFILQSEPRLGTGPAFMSRTPTSHSIARRGRSLCSAS